MFTALCLVVSPLSPFARFLSLSSTAICQWKASRVNLMRSIKSAMKAACINGALDIYVNMSFFTLMDVKRSAWHYGWITSIVITGGIHAALVATRSPITNGAHVMKIDSFILQGNDFFIKRCTCWLNYWWKIVSFFSSSLFVSDITPTVMSSVTESENANERVVTVW